MPVLTLQCQTRQVEENITNTTVYSDVNFNNHLYKYYETPSDILVQNVRTHATVEARVVLNKCQSLKVL